MSPSCFRRGAVMPRISAASGACSADFQRMDAQPSGEMTEYVEYCSISVRSPIAIAIGDLTLMLQYSTYSVISPEGCASILWKSAEQAPEAAEILGITAPRLKQLGLIDKIVNEPVGGAHRDHPAMMVAIKKALTDALRQLQDQPLDALLEAREDKILSY